MLTKDTQIMRRRVATGGQLKAVFIKDDDVKAQLRQVVQALGLDAQLKPFSLCIECNQGLVPKKKELEKLTRGGE